MKDTIPSPAPSCGQDRAHFLCPRYLEQCQVEPDLSGADIETEIDVGSSHRTPVHEGFESRTSTEVPELNDLPWEDSGEIGSYARDLTAPPLLPEIEVESHLEIKAKSEDQLHKLSGPPGYEISELVSLSGTRMRNGRHRAGLSPACSSMPLDAAVDCEIKGSRPKVDCPMMQSTSESTVIHAKSWDALEPLYDTAPADGLASKWGINEGSHGTHPEDTDIEVDSQAEQYQPRLTRAKLARCIEKGPLAPTTAHPMALRGKRKCAAHDGAGSLDSKTLSVKAQQLSTKRCRGAQPSIRSKPTFVYIAPQESRCASPSYLENNTSGSREISSGMAMCLYSNTASHRGKEDSRKMRESAPQRTRWTGYATARKPFGRDWS